MHNWTLLKTRENHIEGYGFIDDLISPGYYTFGIPNRELNKYNEFETEFIPYTPAKYHAVYNIKIPMGILKIYGRWNNEGCVEYNI